MKNFYSFFFRAERREMKRNEEKKLPTLTESIKLNLIQSHFRCSLELAGMKKKKKNFFYAYSFAPSFNVQCSGMCVCVFVCIFDHLKNIVMAMAPKTMSCHVWVDPDSLLFIIIIIIMVIVGCCCYSCRFHLSTLCVSNGFHRQLQLNPIETAPLA